MKLLYFAWVRERLDCASEEVESNAQTVSELIAELRTRDDRYAMTFAEPEAIRASVDQKLVDFDAPLAGAREVAFFPPMTGG